MKKVLCSLALLSALPGFAKADPTSSHLERVLQKGSLNVCTTGYYKPYTFLKENGQYEGIDIAMAESLAASLDVKVNWVPVTWKTLPDEMSAGHCDIAMGGISVTLELRGQADVCHALAAKDCQAIIDFLTHAGVIEGASPPLPALLNPATPLAAVEPVSTPLGGLLVYHAKPGQHLEAGQLIAEIIDPLSDRVTAIRNSQPGLLYARSVRRMATAGMVIAHVAGEQVCRSGYLLGN